MCSLYRQTADSVEISQSDIRGEKGSQRVVSVRACLTFSPPSLLLDPPADILLSERVSIIPSSCSFLLPFHPVAVLPTEGRGQR